LSELYAIDPVRSHSTHPPRRVVSIVTVGKLCSRLLRASRPQKGRVEALS
jgi:hypothetical protein